MKKLEYINEDKNWEKEIVEFEDEHYDVAQQIYIQCKNIFEHVHPVIVSKSNNKKSLILGINLGKTRLEQDNGDNAYRIRIEKINEKITIKNERI